MKVSELKKAFPVEDIAKLETDAKYLVTVPENYSPEQIGELGKALTKAKIKALVVPVSVSFYNLEQ